MRNTLIFTCTLLLFSCVSQTDKKDLIEQDDMVDSVALLNNDNSSMNSYRDLVMINKTTIKMVEFNKINKIYFYHKPYFVKEKYDSTLEYNDYWGLYKYDHNRFYMQKIKASEKQIEAGTGWSYPVFISESDKPIYLFSGIDYTQSFRLEGKYPKIYPIRPGENISASATDQNCAILAFGSVSQADSPKDLPYNKITGFNLIFRYTGNDTINEIVMFQKDTMYIDGNRPEYSMGVEWLGDIDLDGKLDMILNYSNHHANFECRLFLSSQNEIKDIHDYTTLYGYSD